MIGESEAELLLRQIAERRKDLAEQIIQGGVSADNIKGGFREVSGMILGLDMATDLIRDVFRGELPQAAPVAAQEKLRGIPGDY